MAKATKSQATIHDSEPLATKNIEPSDAYYHEVNGLRTNCAPMPH